MAQNLSVLRENDLRDLSQLNPLEANQLSSSEVQQEAPLTEARLVGTKRIAPHRHFKEKTALNYLKVRVPLLPCQRLTPSKNILFLENPPAQQNFPESRENHRILADTAIQAGVNLNDLSEMIMHSDLSEQDPVTGAEDMVEAETAFQSPIQIKINGTSRLKSCLKANPKQRLAIKFKEEEGPHHGQESKAPADIMPKNF